MPGPGVVVNNQSHMHFWKGSLISRHFPCSHVAQPAAKILRLCLQHRLMKISYKKEGRKVEMMQSGLAEELVGSTAPWQGSCLGVTEWQHTVCLSQLCRGKLLCLPAPPLQCPASLDSHWPHLPPWHKALSPPLVTSVSHLCDQWSVVQSLPCQKDPGEFWRSKQHPCTRKLQISSSALISPC